MNKDFKNFEAEYKELNQQDLPDLWDRIEAGLSEKIPAPVNKVFWTKRRIKTFTTMAAVLVCLIVAIPAVMFLRKNQFNISRTAGTAEMTMQKVATDTITGTAEDRAQLDSATTADTTDTTQADGTDATDETATLGIQMAVAPTESTDAATASLGDSKITANADTTGTGTAATADTTQSENPTATLTSPNNNSEPVAVNITVRIQNIEIATGITTLYATVNDIGSSTMTQGETIAIYLDDTQYATYKAILADWNTKVYSALVDSTEYTDTVGECSGYNLVDLYIQ